MSGSGPEGYELRPMVVGEAEAVLAGFNRMFRAVCGEGYVDRTMEQWSWEFAQNPSGMFCVNAWTSEGELAGHFGGVPTTLQTVRGDAVFVQGVDNFVFPEHRRGLSRPGLFVNLGRAWQAHCKEGGAHVIYGYPIITAQRAGTKFLRYVPIWVVDYLVRPLEKGDAPRDSGIEVRRNEPLTAEMDDLFARFAADRTCLVRRDRRYLQWRYVDRPGLDYVVLTARRQGELVGLGVLSQFHELIPGCCTFVDWVVPGVAAEVVDALLDHARELARESGRARLMATFPPGTGEREAFLARGFEVEPSERTMERRLNHILVREDWGVDWVRENWWHTLGDSDLC